MKRLVVIDSNVLFIDNNPQESDEVFYDRSDFIIKNYKKCIDENKNITLDKIVEMSLIYANIKYKKCSYSEDTYLPELILPFM